MDSDEKARRQYHSMQQQPTLLQKYLLHMLVENDGPLLSEEVATEEERRGLGQMQRRGWVRKGKARQNGEYYDLTAEGIKVLEKYLSTFWVVTPGETPPWSKPLAPHVRQALAQPLEPDAVQKRHERNLAFDADRLDKLCERKDARASARASST